MNASNSNILHLVFGELVERRIKKGKPAAGRPITNYYKTATQEQENEGSSQNKRINDRESAELDGGLCWQGAAPEGVTVERTLEFIREESKNCSGPAFLYSQEDVLELHTPVARPARKKDIDSTEWRGWLKGCGPDAPNQAGTPKLDPWEFSPWTPKQMGPKTARKIGSDKRKADDSVIRRATGLDARLKELFPSPAIDQTPSRGASSEERSCVKRPRSSNEEQPGIHARHRSRLTPVEKGVNMNWKTDTVSETTKVSEVIKAPDDGWSDDEFILNLPPELLESGQTAGCDLGNPNIATEKRGFRLTGATNPTSSGADSEKCCLTPFGTSGKGVAGSTECRTTVNDALDTEKDVDVRYIVDSVCEEKGTKRIIARHLYQHFWIAVDLKGMWIETKVHPGESINLIGKVWKEGEWRRIVIDDSQGMIVTHPDFALSGTRVSDAVAGRCMRQTVIAEWINQSGTSNESMLIGTMLHELIQYALRLSMKRKPSHQDITQKLNSIVAENAEGLVEVGVTEKHTLSKLEARIPGLLGWLEMYVGKAPKPEATLKPHWGSKESTNIACISNLIDIEDSFTRSKYGLKGRIDATVTVKIQSKEPEVQLHSRSRKESSKSGVDIQSMDVLSPLEFKTGRRHVAHQAQVALYLMMLEDRYGVERIGPGLLWYLNDPESGDSSEMIQVDNIFLETAALVRGRNALLSFLAGDPISLPPMLGDERTCTKCFAVAPCAILHKVREGGSASSAGYEQLFTELTDHLTEEYSAFFNYWMRFTELEDKQGQLSVDGRYVPTVLKQLRGNMVEFISGKEYALLRELLISLKPPQTHENDQHKDVKEFVKGCRHLNKDQRAAVEQILIPQDYCIVWGMPGTGKTSTIASAIQGLVHMGKSVIVASYTNAAVDNVLLKLEDLEVAFVRVGRPTKIHPRIMKYTLGGEAYSDTTLKSIKEIRETVSVVATTCLGTSNVFVLSKQFDVCIIDEAAQISIPAVLGPIMRCKQFVLVGDPHQLRPLVTSKQAQGEGMGETLLEKLSNKHFKSVAPLRIQYRMASDIMSLANHLVYDGSMESGSESIANRTVHYRTEDSLLISRNPRWMQEVLDPAYCVRFLNTDLVPGNDSGSGTAIKNIIEGKIVVRLLDSLTQLGLSPEDIGVISPFRAQISLLESMCTTYEGLEISTVDTFQGRDKTCIIVSFTKSNVERRAGKLLEDYRRINVILTRAKAKLIAVGSAATLSSVPFLKSLVDFVREKGWMIDLPRASTSWLGSTNEA